MVTNNDLKERIEDHEGRIRTLESDNIRSQEILKNLEKNHEELKSDIRKLENTTLNTNNAILNSINQLISNKDNNETKKVIAKSNNKTEIIKQFLVTISAVVCGVLGAVQYLK
jgi:predicted nuclease with TOPRIM domain